ncbi:oxidoreductase [Variovorax sp. WS11]|uniref:PDR/VanB family oxidoreductase n=1 Tax=Variovorax sp. WS11 TaxID=1105204 RepID=UPI000D0D6B29|nr:PDR/VanB family oxidoreductase [Variovorax sp. WS11]NDZ17172.1 oxidoreductase [Variovorax sp. WS11]PSL79320.1 oxidoreductase [Variovorax sp. WS11]
MSGGHTIAVRVARRRHEAQGISSFELVDAAGGMLPAFTAGAHIDVHLPNGMVRPYSLCNSPGDRGQYMICVLHEPASRGGSRTIHEQVAEGALLRIGAPRNLFPLAAEASHSLLVAGGIGITPILSMAEELWATGSPFELHYSVRSRERAALLARIDASPFAARVTLHCDDGLPVQRLDIHRLLSVAGAGTHLYFCGPPGFMQAMREATEAQGWPAQRVHSESFSAVVAESDSDEDFEVVLARSGRTIKVARGCSVSQTLAAAGVDVPTSCEQGVCGTCLVRVLKGVPDHRDLYLTPAEQARNDQFTPCCSRALTPTLVLDL